ncbi:MAG: heat-inducible transcriptional repressor HrcA [Pseudomonadota bacterium]|nr:heat-inducible transcriptional repressor HrcA [Pseudomonadota bacterium]
MIDSTTQLELGERAQVLLKALIERFIREGEPVGSRTLARDSGLSLSPASVRNVMADLEDLGFVHAPHTSSGRVPTAKGYRLFVDSLLQVKPLDEVEIEHIKDQLSGGEAALDQQSLVTTASTLLSGVTRMTAVVTLPKRSHMGLTHLEFVPLSQNRILAILVFEGKEVENRILEMDRAYSPSELQQAANYLNSLFAGRDLHQVRALIIEEMNRTQKRMSELMTSAIDLADRIFRDDTEDDCVFAGQSNLMGFKELSDIDKLRALFDAFTSKRDILHLLDLAVSANGVQIFIGEESGHQVFDDCSVITSPYQVNGQIVGALGIIGPTRMAYERVIPIVDITAKLLSAVLNHRH